MFKCLRWMAVCMVTLTCVCCSPARSTSGPGQSKGPSLGEVVPDLTPEPFAEEVLGALGPQLHTSVYLTRDGREAFFTHQDPGSYHTTIWVVEQGKGKWGEPRVAPFSGRYDDNCAAFSSDGRRLYFTSNRPPSGEGDAQEPSSVWYVEQVGEGWSEARHVGSPMDLDRDEGTLYFGASLPGGYGGVDVYRIRFVDGRYTAPENVGSTVNTVDDEHVVLAAPDEQFLILYRYIQSDRSRSGLYVCFALPGDMWSEPAYLDDSLRIEWGFDASLSPDGKTLFVLDRGAGIYVVDIAALDPLRPG